MVILFIVIVKKVNCTPFVVFSCLPLLSIKSKAFCSLGGTSGNLERWTRERRGRVVTPGIILKPVKQ